MMYLLAFVYFIKTEKTVEALEALAKTHMGNSQKFYIF